MRKLWKIHIGILIGFFITFISVVIVTCASDKEINAYFPVALLLTYEFLIINFLKDDFLTEEFKERAKRELSEKEYSGISIYRGIIKFVFGVCIIVAPIMWAMAILTN
ncbi:hypothetical protein [Ruminococcus sp.]|uniref:hypothetical protein n=1 Tax=Ruminococcus sp. TaxID=41978 RepID=UPI003F080BBB